jgi:hypothetical protein
VCGRQVVEWAALRATGYVWIERTSLDCMDIVLRDFAADHYTEANKRPPRPEIEAYIKAYDARRPADADARDAPTPEVG